MEQNSKSNLVLTAFPAFKTLIFVMTFFSFALLVQWDFEKWMFTLGAAIFLVTLCLFKRFFLPVYVISCALFGIWLAMNIQQVIVRAPLKIIPEMKAVVQGRVIQVLKDEKTYGRYVVEGTLDTEPLRRFKTTRILLSVNKKTHRENLLKAGTDISADVLLRPPRPKTLTTDFSETEYARSLDVQWLARA